MKATGNFEAVKDVDPMVALSAHTREHIDHWVAKFPPDRQRSADAIAAFSSPMASTSLRMVTEATSLAADTEPPSLRLASRTCTRW